MRFPQEGTGSFLAFPLLNSVQESVLTGADY